MTFKENANTLKTFLKNLIKKDSTTEFVMQVENLDKSIDNMIQDHESVIKQEQETKDKLIEVVKGTSFKLDKEPDSFKGGEESPSIDDVIGEAIKEFSK